MGNNGSYSFFITQIARFPGSGAALNLFGLNRYVANGPTNVNVGVINYKSSVTYTGGTGSGGSCHAGVFTIPTTGRPTAFTYTSNNGSSSYMQFNDSNTSKVTVPNGNTGGNASTSANGTNAGNSSAVTFVNAGAFSNTGTSYLGTTAGSGYANNTSAITTSFPIPSSASFANLGGPGGQGAYMIYWFLL
jgi:hypothetical protein